MQGESDRISAQNRLPTIGGRISLHTKVSEEEWWARQDSNLWPPACEACARLELRNAFAGSAGQSGLSRVHPDRWRKGPDDRTMGNLARQLGPEVIEKLHRRTVGI